MAECSLCIDCFIPFAIPIDLFLKHGNVVVKMPGTLRRIMLLILRYLTVTLKASVPLTFPILIRSPITHVPRCYVEVRHPSVDA